MNKLYDQTKHGIVEKLLKDTSDYLDIRSIQTRMRSVHKPVHECTLRKYLQDWEAEGKLLIKKSRGLRNREVKKYKWYNS